ncbi:MAG: bifunctional PIG-L family deacetylase/class I SAM-dependent methyltransferase [Pseudonocardia sp.]|nr:bifunctional PIG-L family deacetylase/class I SAM-dependent methyltransferase [Pseudonocardia sp.]
MSTPPSGSAEPRPMPAPSGRLVVVAAHPDDETLAAGGFLRAAHEAGCEVEVVIATDGEAAFPGATAADRDRLGRTRRRELYEALGTLGARDVPVHWLGLPDSGLAAVESALAERLKPFLRDADAYLAPWTGDPHPDHAAAGRAAAAAAPVTAHGWSYPIWALVWESPDQGGPKQNGPDQEPLPWSRAFAHTLSAADLEAKRTAIGRFSSQLAPAPGGGPPILPAEVLRHFDTDRELFFREPRTASAPADRFAALYSGGDGDPWETRTSWYEIRKRGILLACLPHARYVRAAEPGCGTGALTRELAARCEAVTASDFSAEAVTATREATRGLPGVTVECRALPDPAALPTGIDLAVLSEVLYYLSPADLDATVNRLADALVAGGDVLVAHWRGWPAEAPQDAEATHRRLCEDPRFDVLLEHTDAAFLLHVLRRR